METQSTESHLSVNETAAALGVHPRTVWRYLRSGHLTAVRHPLSRRVYVRVSEVRAAREEADRRLRNLRPEQGAAG